MIIFGWGRQTLTQLGIVYKNLCNHCHNEDYWILTRIRTWFTLFFIPVIPYSTEYFLSCPICKYGVTLNDEQVDTLKPLAELNQSLVDGKITDNEYYTAVNQLNGDHPKEIESAEKEISATPSKPLSYCANCGTGMTKELKFCGNCGTATSIK